MSTNHKFRVFLSAVSSEFEKARSQVASDLRARGLEIKVQDDFRQEAEADTTLRKLHDYIAGCSAVVCIIGERNGAVPPEPAARPFAALLPAGISEASYTQWELFFARHHRKRLSIYVASPDYAPDRPAPAGLDGQELQQRFVAYLMGQGLDYTPFSTIDELGRRVLREDWPQGGAVETVIPKGLRSFDANDAGFFLQLLPGPFDTDGLPESIRFWKHRIETTDETPFAVGVVYGPSGCGKSSLLKAGLLPHLSPRVLWTHFEATADDTETRLLKELRARCPDLPIELDLKGSIVALRSGQGIRPGCKLLVVIDQFEQWLHAHRGQHDTELVQALRECDGQHVQVLVTIRDDFWVPLSRFMGELGIKLLEGQNLAMVDLFDMVHARNVLQAFGRAYDRLPEKLTPDHETFLDQALQGLSQDGRVISVRLSLFSQMMKDKSWTPATLKEVGGTEGIGVTFLEETFSASTANKKYRTHQNAVMAVLRALLPEQGSDIKGQMRSDTELREKSGYQGRPQDFADLLRILDSELRLITPTDQDPVDETTTASSGSVSAPAGHRYYQLTHDYLVPALREWLTRKQRETRRGRAELLLAERAAAWNAKPEDRLLPSVLEHVRIRALTRRQHWTVGQKKLMRRARRVHLQRGAALAVMVAVLTFAGFSIRNRVIEQQNAQQAKSLVAALLKADVAQVPAIVQELGPYRAWADPLLRAALDGHPADSPERLKVALALLPVDPKQVEYLYVRLLTAEPAEVPVIRDALASHKDELVDRLWTIVEMTAKEQGQQRLRAAVALAKYDPENQRWAKASGTIVEDLVSVNPVFLGLWSEGFRPIKARLLGPLSDVFREQQPERTAERTLATNLLADYAADQPQVLADLVMDADEKQFAIIFAKLKDRGEDGLPLLQGEVDKKPTPDATEETKEKLAKRQANAAVALLKMNQPVKVWPLLKHSPDPRARTYLIHSLAPLGADATTVVRRLDEEPDVSTQRALVLALGEFTDTQLSVAQRQPLVEKLLDVFEKEPDAGLHGAVEWLLRKWEQGNRLQAVLKKLGSNEEQLQARQATDKRQWYVNTEGQTFVILNAGIFEMGSPASEPDRSDIERQHRCRIGRRYAISSTEVTKEQFGRFQKARSEIVQMKTDQWVKTGDSPQTAMTWYEAAAYCDWLSETEGIAKEQRCYEPNEKGEYGPGMKAKAKYLELSGYRLPTEAEWEYACRADTVTSRYYGLTETLLPHYAYYQANGKNRTWPVGSLKPNDLGLSDMLGNAFEWCDDLYESYPEAGSKVSEDSGTTKPATQDDRRVLRGGAFFNQPVVVRSAYRDGDVPSLRNTGDGFRPSRTYP